MFPRSIARIRSRHRFHGLVRMSTSCGSTVPAPSAASCRRCSARAELSVRRPIHKSAMTPAAKGPVITIVLRWTSINPKADDSMGKRLNHASHEKWAAMATRKPVTMAITFLRRVGSWRAIPIPAPIKAVYVAWPRNSPRTWRAYHWKPAASPPAPSGLRTA